MAVQKRQITEGFEENSRSQLQAHLPSDLLNHPAKPVAATLVVLPSLRETSLDDENFLSFYELRFMPLLFLLVNNPDLRIIYLSSRDIAQADIHYYFSLINAPGNAELQSRIAFISTNTPKESRLSLTAAILGNDKLIATIKSLIQSNGHFAYLYPFYVQQEEKLLAERLDIPVFGACYHDLSGMSKSFFRQFCYAAAIKLVPGCENIYSILDLVKSLKKLEKQYNMPCEYILKLNRGHGGEKNAILPRTLLKNKTLTRQPAELFNHLLYSSLEMKDAYLSRFYEDGAVIEMNQIHDYSPSVQLFISPSGIAKVLSTHEQIFEGPISHQYVGGLFPARQESAIKIVNISLKIARKLALEGVMGQISIDFIVVKSPDKPLTVYPVDLNFHRGAAISSYYLFKSLLPGVYDVKNACYRLHINNKIRVYVQRSVCIGLDGQEISLQNIARRLTQIRLGFDAIKQEGVLPFTLSATETAFKFSLLAIADTHQKADAMLTEAIAYFMRLKSWSEPDNRQV